MEMKIILIPIVSAFIGYFTNYLAIKMLFRPYQEKRILGIKVPFTPGLIPKQREKIAKSIAKTIKTHLLPEEKIIYVIKNSNYEDKIRERVKIIIDELVESTSEDIKEIIKNGISIGKVSVKGFFIASALEKALDKISVKLKEKLKEDLYRRTSERIVKQIEEEIPLILSHIDVEKIVEETLLEIDIEELEKIILGISKDQLKYITLMGAFIGFIVGMIQDLIIIIF